MKKFKSKTIVTIYMPKIKNWSKHKGQIATNQIAAWNHEPTRSKIIVTKSSDKLIKKYNITEPYTVEVWGKGGSGIAGTEDIGSYSTKSQAMSAARGYAKRNKGQRLSMPR
jgi:hypothetical protein